MKIELRKEKTSNKIEKKPFLKKSSFQFSKILQKKLFRTYFSLTVVKKRVSKMDTYESEKNCTTHSPVVQKKKTQKKKMEERKIATVIENPSFSTSTNGPSSDSTKKIDSPVQILNNSENSENSGVANQPNELNGPNEPISSNASSSNSSVVSHLKKIEEKFEIDEHIFTWNSDEFVFYDIETTWESPRDIIEFGAIVLDKYGLYEKRIYSTLIHSVNITDKSIECNGITREMVETKIK